MAAFFIFRKNKKNVNYIFLKNIKMKFSQLTYKEKTIHILSILSFVLGWAITFLGLMLPPVGVIDNSVLVAAGQAFVFTAYGLGLNEYIDYKLKKNNEH